MFAMRLGAFWRCGLNLTIMPSSHSAASLDILFGPIVGTPTAFDHFFKIFLHVFELIFNFDGVFFGIASLTFFLIANLLQRSERFPD